MTKSLVTICMVTTILPLQAQDAKPQTQDLWLLLKKALMATDGPEYFEMGMKGALLPPLAGQAGFGHTNRSSKSSCSCDGRR